MKTIKVSDEVEKDLKQLSKAHKMSLSDVANSVIILGLKKLRKWKDV